MAVTAALADATYRSGTTSIASVPIGTAAAGRVVVALCLAEDSNNNILFNETIGGVAIATQDSLADACVLATGTTATIASSGASVLVVTGVYALSGGAAVRPTRVATRFLAADGSISISIEVGAGSTVIARTTNTTGATSGAFGGTAGVSSDGTFTDGGGTFYRVGHANQASAGTVTVTGSVALSLDVWVYDSVGPEWSLIGVSAPVLASSGNLTLAEPSGTAQNDVVIAAISYRSTPAFTNPASWSALATQQSSGNTTNGSGGIPSGLLAGIVRGVGAPSYAFTRTAGSIAQGRAYTHRSSTAGTPSLGTGSAATAGSAALTVTTAGFTPSANIALLFSLTVNGDNTSFLLDMGAATSPVAWAQPDFYIDATAPGLTGIVSSAIQTTAGATGTFTGNNGTSARSALLVGQILPPSGAVVSLPFNQSDFSTPHTIRRSGFDLSNPFNPNLFLPTPPAALPFNQTDWAKPYRLRQSFPPTDSLNPNLFTNPVPFLNLSNPTRPAQVFTAAKQPYNPNLFTIVAQPFTAQVLPPMAVRYFAAPKFAYNLNLYSISALPFNQSDFTPSARRRLGSADQPAYNLNLYAIAPLPFNQYTYPAVQRSPNFIQAPSQGLNPNLFTNQIPILNLAYPSVHHPLPSTLDASTGFLIQNITPPPSTTLIQRTLTGVGL